MLQHSYSKAPVANVVYKRNSQINNEELLERLNTNQIAAWLYVVHMTGLSSYEHFKFPIENQLAPRHAHFFANFFIYS